MHYIYSTFTLLMCFSVLSHSVEPLSEADMSDLALESGVSLLNIYGATAAGIRVEAIGKEDDSETKEEDNNDDTGVKAARSTLKNIEEQITKDFQQEFNDSALDPQLTAIIKPVEQVVGNAAAFDTYSEIRYDKSKFKHEATFNADGSVQHDRDLQIDLLKFENIGGDDLDDPSTIGSIYISDWSSLGSTTTQMRE